MLVAISAPGTRIIHFAVAKIFHKFATSLYFCKIGYLMNKIKKIIPAKIKQ